MTRQDVYNEMKLGKKISHNNFTDNEYLTLKDNHILTEDGYGFTEEFWTRNRLADGWFIFEERLS